MRFEDWEPVYTTIIEDLGYSRSADERARDRLAGRATKFDWTTLSFVDGSSVAIAGGARSLTDDLDIVRKVDVVFAASRAAKVLLEADLTVDLMTTDLDSIPATAADLSRQGTPVAVHAHGDNISAIERWLPQFNTDRVLPTTQAAPRPPVENVGGFTDGDRAAFLADHLGATTLRFPGWDFDDPSVGAEKRRKLQWAERLLYWLERRRDDQFPLLEGRRDNITVIGE